MGLIKSLIDTDLYKLTMMQAALRHFNRTDVEYRFQCRNEAYWTNDFIEKLDKELDSFCQLRFKEVELEFLAKLGFFRDSFLDFLRLYQPNRRHIKTKIGSENNLTIIVKGPWYLTILFEVPVLAIVNQIYFTSNLSQTELTKKILSGRKRLMKKIHYANRENFSFAEFGTRRRFSFEWQSECIRALSVLPNFKGTSNVLLAMEIGLPPIGTMAHEFIMVGAGQGCVHPADSQKFMLQKWAEEFRGQLGIAITDTYGFSAFLSDFDLYLAKLYDGLRHDSGDPFEWGEKAIKHYESLGIDAKTKTLVFSDGLDMKKATKLWNVFKSRANVFFGIGTNLSNDFEGHKPLQIVMKICKCNGRPVAKLCDSREKNFDIEEESTEYLKMVFACKGSS